MDDTISRAAVLEIIREHCPDEPKSKDLREYWKKRFEPLIKVREEVEKIPLADRWIPCKERLPEDDKDVLVTDGEDFAVAYWRKDAQAWDDCFRGWCDLYGMDVVAWMPLPAAYQEGGKE